MRSERPTTPGATSGDPKTPSRDADALDALDAAHDAAYDAAMDAAVARYQRDTLVIALAVGA